MLLLVAIDKTLFTFTYPSCDHNVNLILMCDVSPLDEADLLECESFFFSSSFLSLFTSHMHHHCTHADSGDTEDDLIAVKKYNMLSSLQVNFLIIHLELWTIHMKLFHVQIICDTVH